jgi:hypothetical protein
MDVQYSNSSRVNIKTPLLTIMSFAHTLLTFIIIINIVLYSFDINVPLFDFFTALVPISFILFKKCAHLDLHNYIKSDDIFPEYTEDTYFFSKIQKMFFGKELINRSSIDIYKGAIVGDITSFVELSDKEIIKNIFNEKIQYIVINCIIIIILLTKYKQKKFIPVFLIWFFSVFS